jgi:hypothetical protein
VIVLDQISGAAIATTWPALEPLLRRAYAKLHREMNAAEIRAEAEQNTRALWAIHECDSESGEPIWLVGAGTTRIVSFGGELTCFIDAFAGDGWRDWGLKVLARLESLAAANGVTFMEITGRPAWARTLPGYRLERVTVRKKIDVQ